jgi:hypothetical protein
LVEVYLARLKHQRLNTFSKKVYLVQSNRFLHFNPSHRPIQEGKELKKMTEEWTFKLLQDLATWTDLQGLNFPSQHS